MVLAELSVAFLCISNALLPMYLPLWRFMARGRPHR